MAWKRNGSRSGTTRGAMRANTSIGFSASWLLLGLFWIATASFFPEITQGAGRIGDTDNTTPGLQDLMPGDDRADFLRAAKPSNTGAATSLMLMIDTSRNMAGLKLSMAKRTVIQAIIFSNKKNLILLYLMPPVIFIEAFISK